MRKAKAKKTTGKTRQRMRAARLRLTAAPSVPAGRRRRGRPPKERFDHAITRCIADQARTIRIPVHMIEIINKLWRAQKQLMQELGHEATTEELADALEMSVERVRTVLKMAQQPVSMQSPVGDTDETHFGDLIEDKTAENPSEVTSFNLLRGKLGEVLNGLTERERRILELRYGLNDGYPRTLEEVGHQYEVTRERIRQIEAKTLRKLRHPTRKCKLEGFLETTAVPRAP
jgi:RNA polymerase primary sigma factor